MQTDFPPYAVGRRRRRDARPMNIGGCRLLPGSTADIAGTARAVSRPGAWMGYAGCFGRDGASRSRRRGVRLGGQGHRVRCGIVAAAPLVFLATPARTRVVRAELFLLIHVGSLTFTSSVARFNGRRRQSAHPANQNRLANASRTRRTAALLAVAVPTRSVPSGAVRSIVSDERPSRHAPPGPPGRRSSSSGRLRAYTGMTADLRTHGFEAARAWRWRGGGEDHTYQRANR